MTAQEWLDKEQWQETSDEELLELIVRVRSDAWRQGMSDAAGVILNGRFLHDAAPDALFGKQAADAIVRSRDSTEITT